MAARKSLETMSGAILNWLQSKFAAQSVANEFNEMRCCKPCSHQSWQNEFLFSIWRFFEQSAHVKTHLRCNWPTIHNLISKICPKFQVINSHFFRVDELLDAHWAKIVRSENKMYRSKVCVQEFLYFVSGLDIQLEQSENDNPVCSGCRLQYTTSHIMFF